MTRHVFRQLFRQLFRPQLPLAMSLVTLLAAAGTAGCRPAIAFDVDVTAEAAIERGSLLEDLLEQMSFGELANMDISTTSEFENQQAEKERVVEARLTSATLTITAPEGQDFDFIEEIAFFVSAPGLPEQKLAEKQVPEGVSSFALELAALELAPYVRADRMSVTTEVTGRRPTEDTTVRADLVFHIVAEL